MNKQLFVSQISTILTRGSGSPNELTYFVTKKHDELILEFRLYLELHYPILGKFHIDLVHALNDAGTDIVVKSGDRMVGFQIKSQFDVEENDFAAKVKRQMTDSLARGLDKWYLLICAGDRLERISHLMNEFSNFKTSYCAVYGPLSTIKYFNSSSPMLLEEFNLEMQRHAYEATTLDHLLDVISSVRISSQINSTADIVDNTTSSQPIFPQSLKSMAEVLHWRVTEEQLQPLKEDVIELANKLSKIPKRTRQLLNIILQRSKPEGSSTLIALVPEIESATGLGANELRPQITILEKYHIAQIIESEAGYEIHIGMANPRWMLWDEIKEYCALKRIQLASLIVDLKFDLLDENTD